jgi:protease IV
MIDSLISRTWALEPRFQEIMAMRLLRATSFDGFQERWAVERNNHVPYKISPLKDASHRDMNGNYHAWDVTPGKEKQVAIIPIIGSMTRYGGMCSHGSEDVASWIMEANAMPNISSIVLEINSGGGEVDGTEMLGEVVRQSKKPVVAYVAGMAASAAYWVASQCAEIVMESATTSEVGSIGVLSMHVDSSAYYEAEGHKITILRSDGSEDKALFNSVEALSPKIVATVKADLNRIRGTFIKTVKKGRPAIDAGVFTGKMFAGTEAIKLGMADKIGYLGDAVKRADALSRK